MSYFLFIIRTSLEDFSRNKMRTLLTSLGILIGVASVVLLIALGLGLKQYIKNQFESLGTNLLYVMPGNMQDGGMRGGVVNAIRFDNKDIKTIERVKNSGLVIPMVVKYSKVQSNTESKTYEIIASTTDVFTAMNVEAEYGRIFEKSDVEKGSKVIAIGPKAAETLFGTSEMALHKIVKIEGQGYKVIGVMKSKGGGGLGMPSMDDHIFMPHTAAISFNPDKKYYAIYLKLNSDNVIPQVKTDVKKALLKRYKEDDFSIMEQTEILNSINSIFTILNSVLIAIAAISLIVGGVGIMNIMYVSVVERIREIGIRRAIGAQKKDILYQFLAESVLLSAFGGFLGLLISWIIVLLVQSLFPAYIDAGTVAIALGVSSLVGIVFGVFPAKKAADLSPIDAIRYE